MSKTYSVAVFLLFCVIGATTAASVQDIYVTGDFLLTTIDDEDVTHISSLARFDPESGKFDDPFGGVYQKKLNHPINFIEYANNGLFVTGLFSFVGVTNEYSNSVALYTETNNGTTVTSELKGLGKGIWSEGQDSVKWIVGLPETTLFAGSFDAVEDISLAAGENVVVPSIAQWTKDGQWQTLPNDENVFPTNASIQGVATSPDGVSDIAFIYTENPTGLFSWSQKNGFNDATPSDLPDLLHDTFVVDSLGNPAGISVTSSSPDGSDPEYSLIYIDASDNFAVHSYLINTESTSVFSPTLVPYLDGILIAVPQDSAGDGVFVKTRFEFFNSTLHELVTATVPALDYPIFDVHHLIAGSDGDLWAAPATPTANITRYTTANGFWNPYPLLQLRTIALSVASLTYDWDKKALYGYGIDTDALHAFWFTVPTGNTPLERNPGFVSTDGKIISAIVVEEDDDDKEDSFTLWIAGFFSHVGKDSLPARNLASWRDGKWTPYESLPVSAMALYEDHTLFLTLDDCVTNTQVIPIFFYPVTEEVVLPDPFGGQLPLLVGGAGCVTSITTYKDELYLGGNFTVQIPGSESETATGVVRYNFTSQEWKGIGIPNTIMSSSDGYQILSLVVAKDLDIPDDVDVLLIGGHFEFQVNSKDYKGFAAFSLVEGQGWLDVKTFTAETIVHEIIQGTGNTVFIGGSLQLGTDEPAEGVVEYDFTNNTLVQVGNLSNIANSILLTTENTDDDDDSNDEVIVYAGGSLTGNEGTHNYPVASYDFGEQLSTGKNGNWTNAGTNIFENFFLGRANYLVYETGGSGEGGDNGNAPEPDSDGMNGWWIAVIVIVVLAAVVLVVAAGVAGVWFYKKKNSYQQID